MRTRYSRASLTLGLAPLGLALLLVMWRRGQIGPLPSVWCRWPQSRVLQPLSVSRVLSAWQLDATALTLVAVVAVAYGWGVHRTARSKQCAPGDGADRSAASAWSSWRSVSCATGLLVIVVSTCGSISVYDMSLFSMHMAQHLALIMVAPPLLAAGRPLTLIIRASQPATREQWQRALRSRPISLLTSPPMAYCLYASTIVLTHLTGIMSAVMRSPWLGQAEHGLYLGVGFIFFLLVFGDEPIRWRLSLPARLILIVLSMAVDTFVGIVLMQASQPIAMTAHPTWGSSPLVDTQTGGAIMWVFGDGLMAVIAVLLFAIWARTPEPFHDSTRQALSWFEVTRRAVLADRTGYTVPTGQEQGLGLGLDDDDQALVAYNTWLATLARPRPCPADRVTDTTCGATPLL